MATRSVARLYDRALGGSGLRQVGYSILSRVDAEGPFTISDLAARLAMERTTCSREVDALVTAGLLATEAGTDRRRRMVKLSSVGKRRLIDARTSWQTAQDRLRNALGIDDTEDLLERLRALLRESEKLASSATGAK